MKLKTFTFASSSWNKSLALAHALVPDNFRFVNLKIKNKMRNVKKRFRKIVLLRPKFDLKNKRKRRYESMNL